MAKFLPFDLLPVELLDGIINEVLPKENQSAQNLKSHYDGVAALRRVCWGWKEAVDKNPSLWTSICTAMSSDLRRLALRLSRDHPLNIFASSIPAKIWLHATEGGDDEDDEDADWEAYVVNVASFVEDVVLDSKRWRYLQIRVDDWVEEFNPLVQCPWDSLERLEMAALSDVDDDDLPLHFGMGCYPKLMSLSVKRMLLSRDHSIYAVLEEFTVHTSSNAREEQDGMTADDEFFELLGRMPRLRSLEIDSGDKYEPDDDSPTDFDDSHIIPALQRVFIRGLDAHTTTHLLAHAAVPVQPLFVNCPHYDLPKSIKLAETFGRVCAFGSKWENDQRTLEILMEQSGLRIRDGVGGAAEFFLKALATEMDEDSLDDSVAQIATGLLRNLAREAIAKVTQIILRPTADTVTAFPKIVQVLKELCPEIRNVIILRNEAYTFVPLQEFVQRSFPRPRIVDVVLQNEPIGVEDIEGKLVEELSEL